MSPTTKMLAATAALKLVRSGMTVGLGSGSTATLFIEALGRSIQAGERRDIVGLPTSVASERLARAIGIPVVGFETHFHCDLTIDGADEFDPSLDLIKGLGGAALREKIVAQHSKRLVIIVDSSKRVDRLGQKAPLPVEVVQFALPAHERFLRALGAQPTLRKKKDSQDPFVTDNGNFILDCKFPHGIGDAAGLATALSARAGIVEHGMFLGLASSVIVAEDDGTVRTIDRPGGTPWPTVG
jgi:ribose 5-phosphate isomerase A